MMQTKHQKRFIGLLLLLTVMLLMPGKALASMPADTKMSIDVKSTSVEQVLNEIHRKAKIDFFYDANLAKNWPKITLRAVNKTAEEIIGYTDCIGQELTINSVKFTVVGVIEDDDTSLTREFKKDSYVAYIPYTTLVRISDSTTLEITSFYIGATETGTIKEAEDAMTGILMDRLEDDEDAFSISSQDSLESTMTSVTSILTILLGGIAAISLIVGGIGIMNIMLVTVTERTREIGIRKAIGANRFVILQQFLLEAVVLCMMGCAIGIGLSWAILKVIGVVVSSLSLSFNMNGTVVLVAVGFCFLIGIVFGLYPANKAAKMKPIDALHYGG